uniref:Uncharacterized protein n=1 Tax=Panstrongylus lignarius TaxID=156445 RepID=A0A224Y5Y4_9HEMI
MSLSQIVSKLSIDLCFLFTTKSATNFQFPCLFMGPNPLNDPPTLLIYKHKIIVYIFFYWFILKVIKTILI